MSSNNAATEIRLDIQEDGTYSVTGGQFFQKFNPSDLAISPEAQNKIFGKYDTGEWDSESSYFINYSTYKPSASTDRKHSKFFFLTGMAAIISMPFTMPIVAPAALLFIIASHITSTLLDMTASQINGGIMGLLLIMDGGLKKFEPTGRTDDLKLTEKNTKIQSRFITSLATRTIPTALIGGGYIALGALAITKTLALGTFVGAATIAPWIAIGLGVALLAYAAYMHCDFKSRKKTETAFFNEVEAVFKLYGQQTKQPNEEGVADAGLKESDGTGKQLT